MAEGADNSAPTTSAAAALQPTANWQYQVLSRKSADVTTALAANRLAGILAGHLKAQGIIGQPVFEQATNYAPGVTEYARVEHLVTAVLTKTQYKPQCYRDFIEVLELDYIRPDTEAARSLLPKAAAATTASSSGREGPTTVDDFTEQNIMVIQGKFANLLLIVRKYLQEKIKEDQMKDDLRLFILELFPDISPDLIPNSSNLNEIFEAIRRNQLWGYMNYFSLQQIVRKFCSDSPAVTSELEKFKKDRAGFLLATKIKEYIPAAKAYLREHELQEQLNPINPDHFAKLSLIVDERVADYSLKYLEELWQKLSWHTQLPPIQLLFEMIGSGSIQIVFLIPTKLVPQVIHQAQYSAYFYKMHHIRRVTIGDTCIYESKHTEKDSLVTMTMKQVKPEEEPMLAQTKDLKGGYSCDFVDPPPVGLNTECSVCQQILREPHIASCCSNRFCQSCIKRIKVDGKGCPLCNATTFELMHDKRLEQTLRDLRGTHVQKSTLTSLIAPKPSLKPKDFYWDQIVMIVVFAILGLTVLDIAMELFQHSGVQCYMPASVEMLDNFTRDKVAFINNYCYQSLSPTEYFCVFILAHGLALIAPHYLWTSLFGGYFDFFFDLVKDLNRLRNIKTGEYEAQDFEIVKKLEREYRRKSIFYMYILKLGVQFFFALFSFVFGIAFSHSFSPSFTCPRNADLTGGKLANGWPLNSTITCVYSSLRFLGVIRFVDHTLVGIAAVATLVGLAWCFLRHPAELGYRDIAKFVGDSCFLPENYVPKPFRESPCQPRITNDMDFLLLMLFHTDTGHGKVFKEIQIQKEVDIHHKRDHELLQLFRTAHSEMGSIDNRTSFPRRIHDIHMFFKDCGFKGTPRHDVLRIFGPRFGITKRKFCNEPLDEEEVKKVAEEMARYNYGELKKKPDLELEAEFSNRIHGFIQFAPGNTFAMDISFGSTGCTYILAWAFQEVASVNFDQYLQDPPQEAVGKFFSNVTTMRFPSDIFVQKTDTALRLGEALNSVFYGEGVVGEYNKQNDTHQTCTDFIVVGPIDHNSKKVTVNLLIDRLHQDSSIHKEAVLLAIRPLWIGKKDTSKRFIQYVPPPDLFKRICVNNDKEHQMLQHQIGRESIHAVQVKKEEEMIMAEEDFIRDHPEDETFSREILRKSETTTIDGIQATCGDAKCLFEFAVYRYIKDNQSETAQGSETAVGSYALLSPSVSPSTSPVEMTVEEEYWFQIAQGGIPADSWKPPSRTPTDYSSDSEPSVTNDN